jgi:MtN3 and saliva related transmembrane protein
VPVIRVASTYDVRFPERRTIRRRYRRLWEEADPIVTLTLGYIAGLLTTLAFLPQVIRSWRTRSTADLSLPAILAFIAGVSIWIAYGVAIHSPPVVLWNIVTLLLNLGILAAKVRHG